MGMQRQARVRNDTLAHRDRDKDRSASLETMGAGVQGAGGMMYAALSGHLRGFPPSRAELVPAGSMPEFTVLSLWLIRQLGLSYWGEARRCYPDLPSSMQRAFEGAERGTEDCVEGGGGELPLLLTAKMVTGW